MHDADRPDAIDGCRVYDPDAVDGVRPVGVVHDPTDARRGEKTPGSLPTGGTVTPAVRPLRPLPTDS
jgi:hypothetical protein